MVKYNKDTVQDLRCIMNKTAIKNFAVAARLMLIESVTQRAYEYEVTENGSNDPDQTEAGGHVLTPSERSGRRQLIERIRQNGFAQTMEEAAYTWFNRFIALRFMEVNGYLPARIRVFTDDSGAFRPEILSEAVQLNLEGIDHELVLDLLDAQQNEQLYKYLLITQCNALNASLPEMFEKIGGWTELLFPNHLLRPDSVIARMVSEIPEEDWRDQVQIIGWLYQYYNTEPKDKVFSDLKKKIKISAETIPAATQLFTPDWIVQYMVENSLGRLWTEGHGKPANADWIFYLEEADQEETVRAKLEQLRAEYRNIKPEQIRMIDPCMGSGHILVYAFDVLMDIYTSCGWAERDAALSILQNNLFGLDIDRRAYQLSCFAVMMKARQYHRGILKHGGIQLNLANFADITGVDTSILSGTIRTFAQQFTYADTWGSLMELAAPEDIEAQAAASGMNRKQIAAMIRIYRMLSQKYDVVVTNPPYMAGSKMNEVLSDFVKRNFPDSKNDLFACFMEKCSRLAKPHGFYALITQHAWMFLSSFEALRRKLMMQTTVNMAHLGARAFDDISGEVVQTTAFVMTGYIPDYKGTYIRLLGQNGERGKRDLFLSGEKRYTVKTERFSRIPGVPVAYWVSDRFLDAFDSGLRIDSISDFTGSQHITAKNERYLRYFWEVDSRKIGREKSWAFYAKGGDFRRWYGNIELVVSTSPAAMRFYRENPTSNCLAERYWFTEGITYSAVTSNGTGFRLYPAIGAFDKGGATLCYVRDQDYVLGLLNSRVAEFTFSIMNPTLNLQVKDVKALPVLVSPEQKETVEALVRENVAISREDWDSFETSRDFAAHPFLGYRSGAQTLLSDAFGQWQRDCEERFTRLKSNEEALNRIFIDLYGLQEELSPEVPDREVTVRKADVQRDVRSLITYAVGCLFGRYSPDVSGLCCAGGEWDASKYRTILPTASNVLPICDDTYFEDDLTERVIEFVRIVFGEDTLGDNLRFIADALGGKGMPREVLRNYLLGGFFADHCKVYRKCPVYWLLSSGRKNGFKALVYMHRWERTTVAVVRTDYVHELQERYRTQLTLVEDQMRNAAAGEHVRLKKQQEKLLAQLAEINAYEERVHHLADQMSDIDPDDGVKVNYAKFGDILEKIR